MHCTASRNKMCIMLRHNNRNGTFINEAHSSHKAMTSCSQRRLAHQEMPFASPGRCSAAHNRSKHGFKLAPSPWQWACLVATSHACRRRSLGCFHSMLQKHTSRDTEQTQLQLQQGAASATTGTSGENVLIRQQVVNNTHVKRL